MPDPSPAFAVHLDPESLAPLIARVVGETLAKLQAEAQRLGDRLAYSEPEAAQLLGMNYHQLRDERRRGRITASKIVGGRIAYQREDLLRYLNERRVEAGD